MREVPLQVDWSRERFTRWQSPEDGIEVEYPARYDAARAFGRFTSRDVAGGIVETDVVAFRCGQPRSVIVIATYRAPRPLTWAQWTALAKEPVPPSDGRSPAPFAAELGGSDQTYRELHVEGRPALAVSAKGAVKYPLRGNPRMELWRFESRVMAHGDRAIRITAGVHADHYRSSLPALERVLASFRWSGVGLSRE